MGVGLTHDIQPIDLNNLRTDLFSTRVNNTETGSVACDLGSPSLDKSKLLS